VRALDRLQHLDARGCTEREGRKVMFAIDVEGVVMIVVVCIEVDFANGPCSQVKRRVLLSTDARAVDCVRARRFYRKGTG
jgi:hypothetical protein